MITRKEEKIIITVNPLELRKLADKIERVYNQLNIGDSTYVDTISWDPRIDVHLDQSYFHDIESTRRWNDDTKRKSIAAS